MRKLSTGLIALVLAWPFVANDAAQAPPQTASSRPKSYQFSNGRWFDGKEFRRQTLYSVDGVFTRKKPAQIDEVLDLRDGYVVPPFADAHTHHFDAPYFVAQQIGFTLRDGVFYVKVQTDVRSRAVQVADKLNIPTSVDVTYSHGALTASYGHGVEIYEGLALYQRPGGFTPEQVQKVRDSHLRDNDAYYIIDTAQDLEQKWPRVVAGKPDFIKIYLVETEEYEARKRRTDTVGDRGIDPALVPEIVARSHAAGLRVSAHVATVSDYRVALKAGVDEMAHLPGAGYAFGPNDDLQRYRLSEEDARETARRGVWVVPCPVAISALDPQSSSFDAGKKQRTDAVTTHNLQLLKKHRVKIAIGSDYFGKTPMDDVLYLQRLGIFDNRELLKMWTEDTPRFIFPNRRLGLLKENYEASFLVLGGNPLEDLAQIKNIRMRFKQGYVLNVPGQGS